jgi:hypothetical protein
MDFVRILVGAFAFFVALALSIALLTGKMLHWRPREGHILADRDGEPLAYWAGIGFLVFAIAADVWNIIALERPAPKISGQAYDFSPGLAVAAVVMGLGGNAAYYWAKARRASREVWTRVRFGVLLGGGSSFTPRSCLTCVHLSRCGSLHSFLSGQPQERGLWES